MTEPRATEMKAGELVWYRRATFPPAVDLPGEFVRRNGGRIVVRLTRQDGRTVHRVVAARNIRRRDPEAL